MTYKNFQNSVRQKEKPKELSKELEALWEDANGNWERAHELAQNINFNNGNRIHAYLHRKEGDDFNARYWYSQCGLSLPTVSLNDEWEQMVKEFL